MRKNSPGRTRVFLPGGSNSTNPFPHGSRSHRSQSQVLWTWFLLRRERKSVSCCSIFSAGPPADAGLQLHLSHLCLHDLMIVSPCESSVCLHWKHPPLCMRCSLTALQLSKPLYCRHCEGLFANTATHIDGTHELRGTRPSFRQESFTEEIFFPFEGPLLQLG